MNRLYENLYERGKEILKDYGSRKTRETLLRFEKEHTTVLSKTTKFNYLRNIRKFLDAVNKPIEKIGRDYINRGGITRASSPSSWNP